MKVKPRNQIPDKYKWNTTHLFKTDEDFFAEYEYLKSKLDTFEQYKGKLADKAMLLNCLRHDEEMSKRLQILGLYAHMKKDEDVSQVKYVEMMDSVMALFVKFNTNTSYIVPEISAFCDQKIAEHILDKDFCDFDYYLKEILRNKKHILSTAEEKLLSQMGAFTSKFKETFGMFNNSDIEFEKFQTADGEDVELSHGLYGLLLQDNDRITRERAYKAMFLAYKKLINTIATNYSGNVLKNVFAAKVRNYEGALHKALSRENVDRVVYDNLLDAVENNVKHLQKYAKLRKEVLGLDKLYFYDMYVPMTKGENLELPYEEAYDLVKKALAPMGDEYAKLLEQAYSDGWIDVMENKNKRSGAYMTDAYGTRHPYVLLNYQKTTHDIFTIAHEMGHAMHSHYSNEAQAFAKASYEIFVAEVASTVNEILLLEYLLQDAKGELKKYLLSYYLDMFRTTLFRQASFAEFERAAHEMGENDLPMSADALTKEYQKVLKKYYGDAVEIDDLISYEWARIPHFYSAFYVYKYATGIISAVSIADEILKNPEQAFGQYKKFLSAGGSDSPVEILKLAGVDLTQKQPFIKAMGVFERVLGELQNAI